MMKIFPEKAKIIKEQINQQKKRILLVKKKMKILKLNQIKKEKEKSRMKIIF